MAICEGRLPRENLMPKARHGRGGQAKRFCSCAASQAGNPINQSIDRASRRPVDCVIISVHAQRRRRGENEHGDSSPWRPEREEKENHANIPLLKWPSSHTQTRASEQTNARRHGKKVASYMDTNERSTMQFEKENKTGEEKKGSSSSTECLYLRMCVRVCVCVYLPELARD